MYPEGDLLASSRRMKIEKGELIYCYGEMGNAVMTYICIYLQAALTLILAVLCCLDGPRGHAPWALLATWLSTFGWALLALNMGRHEIGARERVRGRPCCNTRISSVPGDTTKPSDLAPDDPSPDDWTSSSIEEVSEDWSAVDEFAFTGQVWIGIVASCALTGSAIWVTAYSLSTLKSLKSPNGSGDPAFFSAFDIWVPVAIGCHAAAMPAASSTIDKLANIRNKKKPRKAVQLHSQNALLRCLEGLWLAFRHP